jgi:glutaredoxin-dependent peroxiredoxin
MGLQQGDAAPDVTLVSSDMKPVQLADEWKQGPVVLLFFPLAFTSTCTEELCTMRDDIGSYTGLNARVIATSVDSPFVLQRYKQEVGADYLFASDFNREASTAFGVLRESPLGPGLRNASDRAAFVIGRDGAIRYAWHSTNPSLLPPFDEIKQALAA